MQFLANALWTAGHRQEAREAYDESLEIYAAAYGEHDPNYAIALYNRADGYVLEKDFARARALFAKARAIIVDTIGAAHPVVGYIDAGEAQMLLEEERATAALKRLESVRAIASEAGEPALSALGQFLYGRAMVDSKRDVSGGLVAAREGRAALAALGPDMTETVARADQWLARQKGD